MKKHVVSRIPSPLNKSAPVKIGETNSRGAKTSSANSGLTSLKDTLIPQATLSTPRGFEVPYRSYKRSTSPMDEPISPRSKSQIPTLSSSSKSNALRSSHESFFVKSGKGGKSGARKADDKRRNSQDLRDEKPNMASFDAGREGSLRQKEAGDRRGFVSVDYTEGVSMGRSAPRYDMRRSFSHNPNPVQLGGGEEFLAPEEEIIPRPPSRFRDSKTPSPGPSPPISPTPGAITADTALRDPPQILQAPTFDSDKLSTPDLLTPKPQIASAKIQVPTIIRPPRKNSNEDLMEQKQSGEECPRKEGVSKPPTPPSTLPKPMLPLLLRARASSVTREGSQERYAPLRVSRVDSSEGEAETPERIDLKASLGYESGEDRMEVPGIQERADGEESPGTDPRSRPFLRQIGGSASFGHFTAGSSGRGSESPGLSPSSSLNSGYGGLASFGRGLQRGNSLPDTSSSVPRGDSAHPIWFVNPDLPGYVGFANLPNQVHRKSVKKGFEFTLLVVGESGLGKSTLINSLFLSDLYPDRKIPNVQEKIEKTVKIEASTVEIEERGVKLRLTVVDTPGFGDSISNTDSFKNVIKYIDDQFDKYLNDESGLNRRNIVDNRVHCCFYFINPAGHGLKPLDIAFMKAVDHKVNIVPVIAKADTLTYHEVRRLKKKVLEEIDRYGIQIYTLPDCDDDEDEDYKEQCRQLKEAVPFAVVGSSTTIEVRGRKVRGRLYPWGVVEVENPDHCDFIKLRTMLITHMQDLQEVTQEVHYENFRGDRLTGPGEKKKIRDRRGSTDIVEKEEKMSQKEAELAKKEAELRKMQEMLARMQAEMTKQKSTTLPAASTGPAPTQMNNNNTKVNGSATLSSRMNGAPPPPPTSKPPAVHHQ